MTFLKSALKYLGNEVFNAKNDKVKYHKAKGGIMQTGKKINQISNRLRRRSRAIQETIGISGAQGNILNYILVESQNRSVYQKDIEQEFGLRPSTATKALKSLKKNELMGSMKVSNVIAKMAVPSVISSPVKYGDALPANITCKVERIIADTHIIVRYRK